MLSSVWEDAKRQYSMGNMVTRLLIVNVALFVFVNLVFVFLSLFGNGDHVFGSFMEYLMGSYEWSRILFRPWSVFTHFFLHEDFFHILWNMLYLYWFGRILQDFAGNQRVLPIYLLSGLSGFLVYLLTAVVFPGSVAPNVIGASAAVMGIVLATAALAPTYTIQLLFIGPVQLKYIALVIVFLDIIAIPKGGNTGGHIAHLGGALMGYLIIKQMQLGNDVTVPVNKWLDSIYTFVNYLFESVSSLFQPKPKGPRMAYKNKEKVKQRKSQSSRPIKGTPSSDSDTSKQERIDLILDKIKASGYASLTDEEKEFLFRISKD